MQDLPSLKGSDSGTTLSGGSEMNWEDMSSDFNLADSSLLIPNDPCGFDFPALTSAPSTGRSHIAHPAMALTPMSHSPTAGMDFQDFMKEPMSASRTSVPALLSLAPPATPEVKCQGSKCLPSMLQLLENIGVQRACVEATAIDGFLMFLRSATHACSDVLACTSCRLCFDNPMLMATVAQQLGDVCPSLGGSLAQEKTSRNIRRATCNSGLLEGAISFGRFNIETSGMRDALVRSLVSMQLDDLRSLFSRLKNELRPKSEASKIVTEAERKATSVYRMVQDINNSVMDQK